MRNEEVRKLGSNAFRAALALGGFALSVVACGPDQGSLLPPTGAGGTVTGSSGGAAGASGSTTAASGGSAATGAGGTGSSGSSGAAGQGGGLDDAGQDVGTGDPGDAGLQIPVCVFHTDPVVDGGLPHAVLADDGSAGDSEAGLADASTPDAVADALAPSDAAPSDATPRSEGGSDGGGRGEAGGGDGGPAPSITLLTNAFVGPYLADSTGRTLYTYGGDLPGDCNYAPISQCERDCLVAWPLFDAGARTLAPGLDDHAFGTIHRADGSNQTTYYGWPLYYYKTDVAAGQVSGQAKAKTWHAATVIPAGIVILKGLTADKYLADGGGRTLYVFDQDTKGTGSSDPVSACTGACLDAHPVFMKNRISVVSSLTITDFSVFVQGHARQQLAYKGAPLYYAAGDARSGDQTGATTPGWSVAVP
jgi:predicted lipoprotein with Yx(FWY)xxD motif